MACLAAPRALNEVGVAGKGGKGMSGVLHDPNFAGGESRGGCREVPFNMAA